MRKPITSIGEIGVYLGEKEYLFRPSLSAIESLGSPRKIVELYALLFSSPQINPFWPVNSYRSWEREVISVAYDVLVACCNEDVTPLVGCMGSKWGSFVSGAMPSMDMVHLARSLMTDGIIGIRSNLRPAKKPEEEYTPEFKAKEFVAQAVAHLGVSSEEAWNMTMTEFAGAMQSKFGKPETLPPVEEHDEAMLRLAEINRLRKYQVNK